MHAEHRRGPVLWSRAERDKILSAKANEERQEELDISNRRHQEVSSTCGIGNVARNTGDRFHRVNIRKYRVVV